MFEPIDNQRYADLVGCRFNEDLFFNGVLAYGRTHVVGTRLKELRRGRTILITSFSDASVTDRMMRDLPRDVVRWYSNNVETDDPRVVPIPIGFAYNVQRTETLMRHVAAGPLPRSSNLMYVNFTRNARKQRIKRDGLYERFQSLRWVTTKGGGPLWSVSPDEFYTDLREHHYILSPPGAGPDCHRHWEAIALGSIPIVLRSRAMEILEDMPALIVDSWDEVTAFRLRRDLPMLDRRFEWDSMRKLDMRYWRERIHEAARYVRGS